MFGSVADCCISCLNCRNVGTIKIFLINCVQFRLLDYSTRLEHGDVPPSGHVWNCRRYYKEMDGLKLDVGVYMKALEVCGLTVDRGILHPSIDFFLIFRSICAVR